MKQQRKICPTVVVYFLVLGMIVGQSTGGFFFFFIKPIIDCLKVCRNPCIITKKPAQECVTKCFHDWLNATTPLENHENPQLFCNLGCDYS